MKYLYTFAATTMLWGIVAFSLVYFNQVFLFTPAEAVALVAKFNEQQEMLHVLWNALQVCKMS